MGVNFQSILAYGEEVVRKNVIPGMRLVFWESENRDSPGARALYNQIIKHSRESRPGQANCSILDEQTNMRARMESIGNVTYYLNKNDLRHLATVAKQSLQKEIHRLTKCMHTVLEDKSQACGKRKSTVEQERTLAKSYERLTETHISVVTYWVLYHSFKELAGKSEEKD